MTSYILTLTREARSVRVFGQEKCATVAELRYFVDCARLTPSAANAQILKYKICADKKTVDALFPLTRWAGYIKDRKLPPEGKEPTSYIVICHDKTCGTMTAFGQMDVGIAAQTINLAAREAGFAVCMIGSFDKEALTKLLGFDESIEPVLVIAVGEAAEAPEICHVGDDGSIKYFRDADDKHFVPKRSMEDILL